jgi:hypothetical protein
MESQQYHRPANTLSPEVRTFALMIVSLTEEAQVVNWYEQRISAESDPDAWAKMLKAQDQGFKNFCLDLEFLLRQKPKWRSVLRDIIFPKGNTSDPGENAGEEDAAEHH